MNNPSANRESSCLRIVAIGGGTGLSTLLRGLKRHVGQTGRIGFNALRLQTVISDLTAIVAVTDDGGSSGRLHRDLGLLPPGDLRNCLLALSKDEAVLSRLFRHRFPAGGELGGHCFGNLFIAAMADMTGDFVQAIKLVSEVLAIQGRILPASSFNAGLVARMEDGSLVRGETNISASRKRIAEVMLEPDGATALPEALHAIANADLITIGPGSLYTSLITNLLVDGIAEAIAGSRATRIYIANLMTEANESLGLSVAEHIERIYQHAGGPIFDYALVNTGPISESIRMRYATEGAQPTIADIVRIEAMGIRCVTGDLCDKGDVLRHAPDQLAEVVLALACVPNSVTTTQWQLAPSNNLGASASGLLHEGTPIERYVD